MLTLVLAMMLQTETPAEPRCAYDRDTVLALDPWAFDQGPDGWRRLEQIEGCDEAAADLIRLYRSMHGQSGNTTLYVHEAYSRAFAGETGRAIELFELAKHDDDAFGWNIYMDAVIAFLREDRASLVDARARLAGLPIPPDLDVRDRDGNPVDISATWPDNLNVVDNLVRCFGRSIAEAYRLDCPE